MKKYMIRKNYIPEKFYKKKQAKIKKKEKGILLLFFILNLILLPSTAKSVEDMKKVPAIDKMNIERNKPNEIEFNQINLWIENILNEDIEEVYINKNKGEIIINSLDDINNLSTKSISISDINLKDDGKYKLGVNLYE